MRAKEFLESLAKKHGFKISFIDVEYAVAELDPTRSILQGPPDALKFLAELEKYGFSFRPSPSIFKVEVYPPEGGFEVDIKWLKMLVQDKPTVSVPRKLSEVIERFPRSPLPPEESPPPEPMVFDEEEEERKPPPRRPRPIKPPKDVAPRKYRIAYAAIDAMGMKEVKEYIWPSTPTAMRKRKPRPRSVSMIDIEGVGVVKNVSMATGEGTIRIYLHNPRSCRWHKLGSKPVSDHPEAERAYRETIEAVEKEMEIR